MRNHRELELKWILTAAEHAALGQRWVSRFGPPAELAQDNRFFDAADGRLRRAGLSVRIRRENARLVLTCKRGGRAPSAGGLFSHDEWERELPAEFAQRIARPAPGLAAALDLPEPVIAALAGAELTALGGFANQRREWTVDGDLLCLDRSEFPGERVDHELEIESPEAAAHEAAWRTELDAAGIPVRPQTASKLARYLALAAPDRARDEPRAS